MRLERDRLNVEAGAAATLTAAEPDDPSPGRQSSGRLGNDADDRRQYHVRHLVQAQQRSRELQHRGGGSPPKLQNTLDGIPALVRQALHIMLITMDTMTRSQQTSPDLIRHISDQSDDSPAQRCIARNKPCHVSGPHGERTLLRP